MELPKIQREATNSPIEEIQKESDAKAKSDDKELPPVKTGSADSQAEITRGWAEYHHCVCAKSTFALIDHRIWEILWKWAKRRHPRKAHRWIRKRYWHKGNRQWIFKTDNIALFQMADMPIVRIKSLNRNATPFINTDYFKQRKEQHNKEWLRAFACNTAVRSGYYTL